MSGTKVTGTKTTVPTPQERKEMRDKAKADAILTIQSSRAYLLVSVEEAAEGEHPTTVLTMGAFNDKLQLKSIFDLMVMDRLYGELKACQEAKFSPPR